MKSWALRGLGLTALLAGSLLMGVAGAITASAIGLGETPTDRPTSSGQVDGSKILVQVWGTGVKAGTAGSGGGGPAELPMPVPCWMDQSVYTGKTYAEYVDSNQMALDNKHYAEQMTAEEGYSAFKDDDKGHWYYARCEMDSWPDQNDDAGYNTFADAYYATHPWKFFPVGAAIPQPAVPVELLRDFAFRQLTLPAPELNWNPKLAGNQGTLVNLRTWLWLDNAPQSLEVHASVLSGTQASVTATFDGMDITAPGETGFSCRDSGTPYTVGASTNCSLAFSRSSSALGVPRTTVTVATKWSATWEGTGVTQQPLTPSPATDPVDTDIRVDEVQTLVTGTG